MMKTIEVNCYNCGSTSRTFYDIENGYNLNKCNICGLLYVSPRPEDGEIEKAAITGMHKGTSLMDLTGKFNQAKVQRYLKVLKEFYGCGANMSNRRWLDIGCGHGEFLQSILMFCNTEISVRGAEPNAKKIISAREKGLDVDFIDLENHNEKYDCISMLNVFSHLPDPITIIGSWKNLLKSKGELILETGHSAHLRRSDHHKPYYLPDHLSFANKEIVIHILKKLGFKIIKVKVYRFELFPVLGLKQMIKEFIKIAQGKGSIKNIFPKFPKRDLWIRARLIE